IDTDDLQSAGLFLGVHLLQVRRLDPARRAPRTPEVQRHDLAAEVAELGRFAVQQGAGERRGHLALADRDYVALFVGRDEPELAGGVLVNGIGAGRTTGDEQRYGSKRQQRFGASGATEQYSSSAHRRPV